MPKIKKRLKGGSKGERWKKGDSCASNPRSTKFRDAARQRMFQVVKGESELTKEAVASHNANVGDIAKKIDTLHVDPEDYASVGKKSFNTFATQFSTCTIPEFESFFEKFDRSLPLHTKMLNIHTTVQEYMQKNSLEETPSSYACYLIILLEGVKDQEAYITAALSLLSKVIRSVPKELLQEKFSVFDEAFRDILSSFPDGNQTLLVNLIGCISVLLRNQNDIEFTNPARPYLLEKLLNYCIHGNPKVRRCAQYNIVAILQRSSSGVKKKDSDVDMDVEKDVALISPHPGSHIVGKFISDNLQNACETSNAKTTLHLLVFLQNTIFCLSKGSLRSVCEVVLGVMHVGDSLVNICALKALKSLVREDKTPSLGLTTGLNINLINALMNSSEGEGTLLKLAPNLHDEKFCFVWISAITALLFNLSKQSEANGIKHIGFFSKQLVTYFKSEFPSIQEEVFFSFEKLLDECIAPLGERMNDYSSEIQTLFESIEKGLSLQFQPAWAFIFRTISACFRVIGPHLPHIMVSCLKNLAQLADDLDISNRGLLELAIGSALDSIGPAEVLRVVPLQITGNLTDDQRHFWILPVLQKYTKNSRVSYFVTYFYPLAKKCSLLLKKLDVADKHETLIAKSYRTIEQQIWGLLPSFANGAVDAGQAIGMEVIDYEELAKTMSTRKKIFGRELCNHIKNNEQTRLYAIAALRNMVLASKDNPGKLEDYAKNYLPALFTLYSTRPFNCRIKPPKEEEKMEPFIDPGHRLSAFATIEAYLPITPKATLMELFTKAFDHFKEKSDPFKKLACLSLLRTFIPHLDSTSLGEVYIQISHIISNPKETVLQKSAYRFLEDLLNDTRETSKEFVHSKVEEIGHLLMNSMHATSENAWASRLRSLGHLLNHIPDTIGPDTVDFIIRKIFSESVLCCGEGNSSPTKKAAFHLLASLETVLQSLLKISQEEALKRCFEMLLAGLNSLNESPTLVANSVLALTASLYRYKEFISKELLDFMVKSVSLLVVSSNRGIVKSCLNFFRMSFVIFPIEMTSEHVEIVVKAIVNMDENCLRKFRIKTRDLFASLLRKYGYDRIVAFIPDEDVILKKRVKNIRKIEDRKKRRANIGSNPDSSDEDEDEKGPASLQDILAEIDADIETDDEQETKKKEDKNPKKRKQKKEVWFQEDEDQIVDLLDPQSVEAFTTKNPGKLKHSEPSFSKKEDNYGFKIDSASGKFIITEDKESSSKPSQESDAEFTRDLKEALELKGAAQSGKIKRKRRASETSVDTSEPPSKMKPGLTRKSRTQANKFDYGSEFRSKKGSGDVSKKGGVAPYAYVQLSKEKLNKRKKAKLAGQFRNLVKGAKRGVVTGKKLRRRKK